jgi:hypothetical protein
MSAFGRKADIDAGKATIGERGRSSHYY